MIAEVQALPDAERFLPLLNKQVGILIESGKTDLPLLLNSLESSHIMKTEETSDIRTSLGLDVSFHHLVHAMSI